VTYTIAVKREGKGSSISLVVDGKPVAGDVVPLPTTDTGEVSVEATIY
jgi:cellobiose phosphorylase